MIWTGAGGNANLNTAGNWAANVVPQQDDSLVFPAGVALETVSRSPALVLIIFPSIVILGVMFILDGVAFIVVRHYTNPGAAIAAGVLYIIAGGFVCSVLFAIIGGLVLMPALIIGGIVLVNAPIPILYAPQAGYGPTDPRPPFPQ